MSDWSRRQFAMAMVAGGMPIKDAIGTVRAFEALWGHEEAYDRAFTDSLVAADKAHSGKPTQAQIVEWICAARRAGEVARDASIAQHEATK